MGICYVPKGWGVILKEVDDMMFSLVWERCEDGDDVMFPSEDERWG